MKNDVHDILGLDDLDSAPSKAGAKAAPVKIYKETCRACRGTGKFTSYTGRIVGNCFKCEGLGFKTFKTSPEARAARKTNAKSRRASIEASNAVKALQWLAANPERAAFLEQGWEFPRSLSASLKSFGSLTANQVAAIDRCIAKQAQRKAERAEAGATELDLSSLPAGRYAVPEGETRLKIMVRKPTKGNWAGWIFVSDAAEYGSRKNYGRQGRGENYNGTCTEQLKAIMADPMAASIAYGKLVGCCGVCGRTLEDPESVAAGIGPVCARKFS